MTSSKVRALFIAGLATFVMGLGYAAMASPRPDDSPLHELMEKVQANNAVILKGVRTEANFRKSKDDVVKAAQDLIELGKEARKATEPAQKEKQPQSRWEELTDAMIKESEKFASAVAKPDIKQADAKNAYKAVQRSCTDCHDVFRKDE
ncbi:MAG: hypothetical protein KatS3mg108_3259 [Isosphaeraceae bacterium]|jgi:cytochrome c556|nr:MAG: hypothetical protein KatS3mg108_3259 [Isosphaeraceae bacterium]